MTSWLVRRVLPKSMTDPHHEVRVFAGPDADHRLLQADRVLLPVDVSGLHRQPVAADQTDALGGGAAPEGRQGRREGQGDPG